MDEHVMAILHEQILDADFWVSIVSICKVMVNDSIFQIIEDFAIIVLKINLVQIISV